MLGALFRRGASAYGARISKSVSVWRLGKMQVRVTVLLAP